MQGLQSLHLSVFHTVDHHQLRKQQPTVQGCMTVQRLIFGEIVKWGLRGFAAAGLRGCHMFTTAGLWVGGWVSRLGPVIRRAIYIPSSSAVGGVVIWAFLHNLFKHSGIWQLAGLFIALNAALALWICCCKASHSVTKVFNNVFNNGACCVKGSCAVVKITLNRKVYWYTSIRCYDSWLTFLS